MPCDGSARSSSPRFEDKESHDLSSTLQAMGMKRAFTGDADFSGITTDARIGIGSVAHATFVNIDEKGTEAAAATAEIFAGMGLGGEPVAVEFLADHPFLVILRDQGTGSILFMGHVVDPAA